jgi:alpha-amylase
MMILFIYPVDVKHELKLTTFCMHHSSYSHDTQRNGRAQLTYKNGTLYTFANLFMLAWPYAQVRVMSSYYFTDTDAGPPSVGVSDGQNCQDGKNWVCEHRWSAIGNMVAWRNLADKSDIANWATGTANQIAFSRNGKAWIALNRDPNSAWVTGTLKTGLPAGTYCNVLAANDANADQPGSCKSTVTVDGGGNVAGVQVPALSGVALHTNAKL